MNTVNIKKTIEITAKKIQTLKSESEKINAELKKLEEKNKTLTALLKRQEAIDQEYAALSEPKPVKKKSAAADDETHDAAVE